MRAKVNTVFQMNEMFWLIKDVDKTVMGIMIFDFQSNITNSWNTDSRLYVNEKISNMKDYTTNVSEKADWNHIENINVDRA